MTGRVSSPSLVVRLSSMPSTPYPPPHTHLIIKAKNESEVAWSDSRRFGQVVLSDSCAMFDALAPDALSLADPAAAARATHLLAASKKPIKALLLDQNFAVSGVGNWIADEVLYQASIHPAQARLTCAAAERIVRKVLEVCETAVGCNEERLAKGSGEDMNGFPNHWLFHFRWVKKAQGAKDFHGRSITFVKSGGRTSAVVAQVQKRMGREAAAEGKEKGEVVVKEEGEGEGEKGKKKGKGGGKKAEVEGNAKGKRKVSTSMAGKAKLLEKLRKK